MKKPLLILLLCFSLFLCACGKQESEELAVPDLPEEEQSTEVLYDIAVIVDADYVNVRIAPSLDARILDTALRGTVFRVADHGAEDENGDRWVEVACYGDTAFVFSEYVYELTWSESEPLLLAAAKEADTPVYSAPECEDILFSVGKYEAFVIEEKGADGVYKVFDPLSDAYIKAEDVEVKESLISEVLVQ